jgi:glycosyltransferase involved in cell wall biosynthesis
MNSGPSRKKLVQILRSASYGGVETHVLDIIRLCDKSSYDISLISLTNAPVSDKFQELGIRIFRLEDTEWMSRRSLQNILPLAKLLRRLRPDIVHLHGMRPFFVGSVAARLAGVPRIVSTVHSSYKLTVPADSGNRLIRLLNAGKIVSLTGLMLSTRVITVSNYLSAECRGIAAVLPGFVGKRLRDKIITVYHGIDTSKYAANVSQDGRFHEDYKVVGTVSRLDEPYKGIGILIKALHVLVANSHKVKLKIAGDGHSQYALEKLVQSCNLEKHVEFCGFRSDVPVFLRGIDIFVLPSLSEGFGLVNLEAMAAGIPVIASDTGGVSEAVRDGINGYLVPPGNATALADKIAYLLEHRDIRETMGSNGRQDVADKFELQKNLNLVFAVYNRMFAG